MLRDLALAAALVLSGSAQASNVPVVARSGGMYNQIQPAIDAAQSDDVVPVKAENYASFSILGKGTAVVADVGGVVVVQKVAEVRHLVSDRDVLLHRLRLDWRPGSLVSRL